VGNALEQVPGPLEIELRIGVQQDICFVGAAESMPKFYVRSRPTRMYPAFFVDTYEKAGAK
jgi:hypothetical protein